MVECGPFRTGSHVVDTIKTARRTGRHVVDTIKAAARRTGRHEVDTANALFTRQQDLENVKTSQRFTAPGKT